MQKAEGTKARIIKETKKRETERDWKEKQKKATLY